MQSFGIPQGMRDILGEESRERTILKDKLRNYMLSCGFSSVETSLFEFYDLFSGENSPIDDESIIKTIDRNGKVIVLRPDMTVPAARVAATKLKEQPKPMKLCYVGNVYRSDKKARGTARELCQVGAEIFGGDTKCADMELISMLKGCFREASIEGYKIDIGHAGIVEGILKELDLQEEEKSALVALIREKNLVELGKKANDMNIALEYKELICRLPSFFGTPGDIFRRLDEVIINDAVKRSADYLVEVYKRCIEIGLESNLIIDIGMTGGTNYYTGLIFRAYAKGVGSPVLSGGRYDSLMGHIGTNCTAAGFAVDMDSMIKAAGMEGVKKPREHKVLVLYSIDRFREALIYSEECRRAGSAASLISCLDIPDAGLYMKQYGYDEIISFR